MTKKHKHHSFAASPADLGPRIERARQEGRFQQALDLAKQLHKHEPTPAHLDLLQEMYLGRARQLRGQGQTRDALTILETALRVDQTTPAWRERLAEELALCGDVPRALALADGLPESGRILAHVADGAMQQGAAGRAALSPALQADFDGIVRAFAQAEAGQDDAARETLQSIGLRSPFLEWKMLLRGLQAYWLNEDVRALENWQRLNPERTPARLAAPFRCRIDPAYRTAQPPATQAALQKQLDHLQDAPLVSPLRTLQATLADRSKSAAAYRQAETLVPILRNEAPHLLPRLAVAFYWSILEAGPDDVMRYQRVFGHPPDDANFHRLHALGYERGDDLAEAHRYWQNYEREIADHPERWPGEQADHARAFIWQRMGRNAASIPEPRRQSRDFLFGDETAALKPSAEKCFQKSLELAPDLLETHEALVRHHVEGRREGKAEKAARTLLQHFPDHGPTLQLLSDLRLKHGDHAEALALAERALQGNPLDRRLRRKLGDVHLLAARSFVEQAQFDEARRHFQSALELSGGPNGSMILAHWAACEFRAGDSAGAEELIEQALARTTAPVGVAYLLLTEVLRLKLDRALKTRFEQSLKEGLAVPTPAGAVYLTRILAGLHAGGVSYVGKKGHTQKVLAYIHKTRSLDFAEPELEELCQNLLDLKAYPKARHFADKGDRRYPDNPFFPYLHALGWIQAEGRRVSSYDVVPLLLEAQRRAQALPPNERRERLLADLEQHLRELSPIGLDFLGRLFEHMGGTMDDEWEDE